jgi:hypothetical protein
MRAVSTVDSRRDAVEIHVAEVRESLAGIEFSVGRPAYSCGWMYQMTFGNSTRFAPKWRKIRQTSLRQ